MHHPPHVDGAGELLVRAGPGVDPLDQNQRHVERMRARQDLLDARRPRDPLAPRVRPRAHHRVGAEAAEPRRLQQGVQCALDVVRHHTCAAAHRRVSIQHAPPRWALRCVASRHGGGRAMGSNLREALDTLLVALLAKALLDAELRLGRVDERALIAVEMIVMPRAPLSCRRMAAARAGASRRPCRPCRRAAPVVASSSCGAKSS